MNQGLTNHVWKLISRDSRSHSLTRLFRKGDELKMRKRTCSLEKTNQTFASKQVQWNVRAYKSTELLTYLLGLDEKTTSLIEMRLENQFILIMIY